MASSVAFPISRSAWERQHAKEAVVEAKQAAKEIRHIADRIRRMSDLYRERLEGKRVQR